MAKNSSPKELGASYFSGVRNTPLGQASDDVIKAISRKILPKHITVLADILIAELVNLGATDILLKINSSIARALEILEKYKDKK